MEPPLLECVPNFSEGLDAEVVRDVVRSMQVGAVRLLDSSLDSDHNRSVVTVAGSPSDVVEAAVRAAGVAAERIDLTRQKGVHPRIGAADVVPFVPVRGLSLAEAAMYARQAGREIWRRFGVPVYFYGAAATRPDRTNLEDVRRGQFEGLREAVLADSTRHPDVGGPELHPTAGASVVGARAFLIAYNLYLAGPAEISHARAIARDLRAANGGLPGVKALGVLVNGRAQLTMNITDFHQTPMATVYGRVQELARQHGAMVAEGELVGLVPEAACAGDPGWMECIPGFRQEEKILERRLEQPLEWPAVPSQPESPGPVNGGTAA